MNTKMHEKYAKKALVSQSKGSDRAALMIQNTGSRATRNNIAKSQSISSMATSGTLNPSISPKLNELEKKKSLKNIATGVMKANSKIILI